MKGKQEEMLEEFYYMVKQQARENMHQAVPIRFTGRTASEFKQEIFNIEPAVQAVTNITFRDLELLYNNQILGDDDEMEYCLTTYEKPLLVFIPTELSMNEYKNYMTVALQSIDSYKRQHLEYQSDSLELQQKLERIIFNFSLPHLDDQELQNAIPPE